VLYDGSPGHPDLDVLWDLAERTRMSCFGTSASYIASCMKAGVEPRAGRDLGALRSVGSTGSPLAPEGFEWVYDHVGRDTWLFSASGGTDLCTAFVGGCPLLPVYRGELQARALGAKVQAFDEHRNAVIDQVGELVLTEPMPSMPLFFWNDPDGERYRDSYFATYPGVWRHGDWIEITSRGTAIIYGRSDATINRGGIRIGTSEIYRAVLTLPDTVGEPQRPGRRRERERRARHEQRRHALRVHQGHQSRVALVLVAFPTVIIRGRRVAPGALGRRHARFHEIVVNARVRGLRVEPVELPEQVRRLPGVDLYLSLCPKSGRVLRSQVRGSSGLVMMVRGVGSGARPGGQGHRCAARCARPCRAAR
jgi:acyl-CoA synthetase (AMP-forming)/AMP-acid ligase II